MRFGVYGGFEILRQKNRLGKFDKVALREFWAGVDEAAAGLRHACGCYVFALQHSPNIVAWYVGMTQNTFEKECFKHHKVVYYNQTLASHSGKPLLFLIPRVTPVGQKFSKPSVNEHHDIGHLETMLIGMALKKNPKLWNVRDTRFLREMVVPGVINSPQAAPTLPQRDLKKALGLS